MTTHTNSKKALCLTIIFSTIFSSLSFISVMGVFSVSNTLIVSFWFLSIVFALFFAAKLPLTAKNLDQDVATRLDRKEIIIVTILVLFSFIYLTKDIGVLPYVVHGDEAEQALNAKRILEAKPFNMFSLGWYDIPYPSFLINVPALSLFGYNLLGLRITSVVEGVITVFMTYLIAKLILKSKLFATLSALTLLSTPLFTHFARSGASYMQATMTTTIAIYFYLKAHQRVKATYTDISLAGIFSGFGFLVYYAGRVALFIILLSIPISFFNKKITAKHIFLLIFGFLIIIAPYIPAWIKNPEAFNSRTSQVLIFNEWQHVTGGKVDTPIFEVLGKQIYNTLNFFVNQPDGSEQFGIKNGGFTIPLTIFMIIGIFMLLPNLFKNNNHVLILWFLSSIGAVMATIDAPFSPRLVTATPIVSIFATIALLYLSKVIDKIFSNILSQKTLFVTNLPITQFLLAPIIVVVLIFIGTHKYFIAYKANQPDNVYTVIGRFLVKNAISLGKKQTCIFSDTGLSEQYPTVVLLAPDTKVKIVDPRMNNRDCQAYIFKPIYADKIRSLTKGKHLRSQSVLNYDGQVVFESLIP